MHIAFDIGNVLCYFYPDEYIKVVQEKTKSSEQEIKEFVEYFEKISFLGLLTLEQALKSKWPFLTNKDIDIILKAWDATVYPNDQMINFIKALKYENVKIALLSNIGHDHEKYLKNSVPEIFDGSISHLSHEVGAYKPQKLFYQSFLLNHEEFSGCVYLDDKKENIVAGAKMNFDAIHFDLHELTFNKQPSVLKNKLIQIKNRLARGY